MPINTESWKRTTVTNNGWTFIAEYTGAKPALSDEVTIIRSVNDIDFKRVTMTLETAQSLKDSLVQIFDLLA